MDYVFVKSKKRGRGDFGAIYARIRTKDVNKKYSLGFTLKEQEWKKYRSLQYMSSSLITSIGIRYGQFASVLACIKCEIENDFRPEMASAIIRSTKVKVLNGPGSYLGQKKLFISFCAYIQGYIDQLRNGSKTKMGYSCPVSTGYIKNLCSLLNSVRRYEKERHTVLSLDDINLAFQQDFIRWSRDQGLSPNTISSQLSRIRTLMNFANEQKLTTCDDCKRTGFVPRQQEVDQVYLTPDQIQEMMELNLSSREAIGAHLQTSKIAPERKKKLTQVLRKCTPETLERTRDVFIVGCLTGQRVSDYSRFSSEMITEMDGKQFLGIIQQKTGKKVFIPLDKRVKTILEKYKGNLPRIHYKTQIHYIKLLGELLQWTKSMEVQRGVKKEVRFCDLLGTHTARRSFATNAYAAGVPLSSIMAVTGHASEKVLRKYLRLNEREKAILAADNLKGVIQLV